jgi:cell fate (sporulation/competence/biofilm development) regulator YmcA (YheA/YmcA/DUF963 family)
VDRTEDFSLNANQRAKAEARYAELKASPKYAALIQRFAAQEAAKTAKASAGEADAAAVSAR